MYDHIPIPTQKRSYYFMVTSCGRVKFFFLPIYSNYKDFSGYIILSWKSDMLAGRCARTLYHLKLQFTLNIFTVGFFLSVRRLQIYQISKANRNCVIQFNTRHILFGFYLDKFRISHHFMISHRKVLTQWNTSFNLTLLSQHCRNKIAANKSDKCCCVPQHSKYILILDSIFYCVFLG